MKTNAVLHVEALKFEMFRLFRVMTGCFKNFWNQRTLLTSALRRIASAAHGDLVAPLFSNACHACGMNPVTAKNRKLNFCFVILSCAITLLILLQGSQLFPTPPQASSASCSVFLPPHHPNHCHWDSTQSMHSHFELSVCCPFQQKSLLHFKKAQTWFQR